MPTEDDLWLITCDECSGRGGGDDWLCEYCGGKGYTYA